MMMMMTIIRVCNGSGICKEQEIGNSTVKTGVTTTTTLILTLQKKVRTGS